MRPHLRARAGGRGHDDVRVSARERRAPAHARQALERGGSCASSTSRRACDGELGARAATCCSSPTTSRGSTSSCSTRTIPVRFVAKSEIATLARAVADGPRRRHGVHRARAAARHASRERSDMARRARRRRRRRDLSRGHDHRTATRCCRSRARCCSRSSRRDGHVQPVAIRYRTPDGEHRDGADVRGRHDASRSRSGAVCGERALQVELIARPALPARDRASARARARRGSVYPNGFGCTGARDGTWYSSPVRQACTAVSVPPHTHPESSISTFGVEHEVERRPVAAHDGRPRRRAARDARTTAMKPSGVLAGPRFSVKLHRVVGACRSAAACRR